MRRKSQKATRQTTATSISGSLNVVGVLLGARPAHPSASCASGGIPHRPLRCRRAILATYHLAAPLLLFLVALTASFVGRTPATRYTFASIAILITLGFWRLHVRKQPYAFDFQNALESWLYGSTALLLLLACFHLGLKGSGDTVRMVLEVLMLLVLVGGLVASAVFIWRRVREGRKAMAEADLSAAILADADDKIDGPLRKRLEDGDIRLLRCSWLLSGCQCQSRPRPSSKAPIMKRQQELPDAAFVPSEEAAAMLECGDRSILALSSRLAHPSSSRPSRHHSERCAQLPTSRRVTSRAAGCSGTLRHCPKRTHRAIAANETRNPWTRA